MMPLDLFGTLGALGIGVALAVLGLLSRRLGEATRAEPRFLGFFIAASFCFLSALVQIANLLFHIADADARAASLLWVFLYHGLPAVGVTVGIVFTWHYWSWLLAERDS